MPLTIEDIQTTDLIYYDHEFNDICFRFCKERDIDFLPSLEDPKKAFRRYRDGFQEVDLQEEIWIDCHVDIFDPQVAQAFARHPLLFVLDHQRLSGVLHFSDYNRPVIHTFLFNLISAYERSLRELLCLNGLKNQHMRHYFASKLETCPEKEKVLYQRKINSYDKASSRMEKEKEFVCFELADLINLVKEEKMIDLAADTYDLRNDVMHAHHLIRYKHPDLDNSIFDLKSFNIFIKRVTRLHQDYKRVLNRIKLSTGIHEQRD